MAMVRDPLTKETPPLAVTDKIVGENATCMTDNRRRYHHQGLALPLDKLLEPHESGDEKHL